MPVLLELHIHFLVLDRLAAGPEELFALRGVMGVVFVGQLNFLQVHFNNGVRVVFGLILLASSFGDVVDLD